MIGFTVPGAIESIRSGKKVTTIRLANPKREASIRASGRYDLYWKPRTKECELIGRYPLVSMTPFSYSIEAWHEELQQLLDDPQTKATAHQKMRGKRERIAHRDGFRTANEMYEWFSMQYGDVALGELQFTIHEWDPKRPIDWAPRRVA